MIEKEDFPIYFRKTLLNMIWKQKGPADILKNNRSIHTKEHFLPRTCEAIVLEKSSMYQVGGQPGQSPE